MRRVRCKIYSCGGVSVKEFDGKFHQWGLSSAENCEGHLVSYTVAIVECGDGKVFTVPPSNVEFLD